MSRNIRRFIRSQKSNRVGHILRRSHSPERNRLKRVLFELFRETRGHRSFDETRRNRITSDISRPNLARYSHRQPNQTSLRRRVISLPRLPHLSENGSYIDDPPPPLLEHGANSLLSAHIRRGQIGIENSIPIRALHAHKQLIASNSRIVHENIDLAQLRDRALERALDLFFISNIERKRKSLSSAAFDFLHELSQLFLATRCDRYSSAGRRQLESAGAANPLRCTSHQRNPS